MATADAAEVTLHAIQFPEKTLRLALVEAPAEERLERLQPRVAGLP